MKRYSAGARFYDVLSGERWVYRAGRVAGISALGVKPGDTVLDLGCGTGLNFPLLVEAVGPTGLVIGLDRSPDMLRMARARVSEAKWRNVRLIEADARTFDPLEVVAVAGGPVNVVFATYSLSVIGDWRPAWERMLGALRPGGRAGIVDMALPTGAGAVFAPLARLVCAFGGADLAAHPWTTLEKQGSDVSHQKLRSGHVRVVTGTIGSVD